MTLTIKIVKLIRKIQVHNLNKYTIKRLKLHLINHYIKIKSINSFQTLTLNTSLKPVSVGFI